MEDSQVELPPEGSSKPVSAGNEGGETLQITATVATEEALLDALDLGPNYRQAWHHGLLSLPWTSPSNLQSLCLDAVHTLLASAACRSELYTEEPLVALSEL